MAKLVLAVVSVVLLLSMGGGFLLLPLLVPLHIWAARRSGPIGRVGWSVIPVAAIAMATWAVVYVIAGETKPLIWLLPVVAATVASIWMSRTTRILRPAPMLPA